MASLPTSQSALVVTGYGKMILQHNVFLPPLEPEMILIKTAAAALNPHDVKSIDLSPVRGSISGCECAGVVIGVGHVARERFNVGARVCGVLVGNNPKTPGYGAFAEYAIIPANQTMHIPNTLGFCEATTLGLASCTIGLALYRTGDLPAPDRPSDFMDRPTVLVYGGSSATGAMALQLLRLSGLSPIATCSPHNFEFVKSRGAVAVFDYHSSSCGKDIRTYTNGCVSLALDCITMLDSMTICYQAIGPQGGRYVSLDPFMIRQHTRRDIKPSYIPAPYAENQASSISRASFASKWITIIEALVADSKIKSHPMRKLGGGLRGIIDGLSILRKGDVSAERLVYCIADEPLDEHPHE